MNDIDRARMVLGLIKLKEAIYARRSGWTEADREEFLVALKIALDSVASKPLNAEPPPTIKIVWDNQLKNNQ